MESRQLKVVLPVIEKDVCIFMCKLSKFKELSNESELDLEKCVAGEGKDLNSFEILKNLIREWYYLSKCIYQFLCKISGGSQDLPDCIKLLKSEYFDTFENTLRVYGNFNSAHHLKDTIKLFPQLSFGQTPLIL